MPPVFKDRQEIFDAMLADVVAAAPGLTSLVYNAAFRGVLRVVANAVGGVYDAATVVYYAIFPQLADILALRNHVETFGLPWVEGTDEAAARRFALSLYRAHFLGTPAWYELEVLYAFPEVEVAQAIAGARGANTLGLFVGAYGGAEIPRKKLTEIADYFGDGKRGVWAMDFFVANVSAMGGYLEGSEE